MFLGSIQEQRQQQQNFKRQYQLLNHNPYIQQPLKLVLGDECIK